MNKIPNVVNYDKKDYAAGRQNWDVKIDQYGVVFFGNSEGLLYNDCGEWGLAKMTSNEVVRSLYIDKDTIWAGGNEYGYFLRSDDGFEFTSLGVLEYQQIWNIEVIDNTVMFQTEDKIILYHKIAKTTTSITYYEGINASAQWNNEVWVLLRDGRLGHIVQNKLVIKDSIGIFKDQQTRKLIVHNNKLYIPLYNGKIYSYDKKTLKDVTIHNTPIEKAFFTGVSYDKNSLCLGSVANGFFRIDSEGNIIDNVTQNDGLLDNTILAMAKDGLGNIWLGLDYGIAKIELQNAISTLFKGAATYSITDYNHKIYLGTNKGLYQSLENGRFKLEEEIKGQIWNTKVIDNQIYISHNSGLTTLTSSNVNKAIVHTGVFDIAPFKGTKLYLISTYDGLQLYTKNNDQFLYVSKPNFYGFAQLYYDEENDCIWGEIKNKDLIKVTLNEGATVSVQTQKGIKKVFKTNKGFIFWDNKKFLSYQDKTFTPLNHSLLNTVPEGEIAALALNLKSNILSFIRKRKVHLIELLSDGNTHSYDALLRSLDGDTNKDFEYLDFKNGLLRIATDHGLTVCDVKYQSEFKQDNHPIISSIEITNNNEKYIYPYLKKLDFSKGEKDITFHFYIEKLSSDIAEFRYKLSPIENEWSEWSTTKKTLTKQNLQGGEYNLTLQSKVNTGKIKESSLQFKIERYWYETPLIVLPIGFFLLVIIYFFILFSRSIHFKKLNSQKKYLEQQKAQEIISLKEEQLLKYMEIINHKDDFLVKVQGGLDRMRNNEAKKWSTLIESEINNEKKDLLFHKLFSDIQQDFIKAITAQYPTLTANDLRIISFIRINLSSKEISNLMNINPRSLDTSRYRLRKKLNLEQGVDLHKFIREF